MYQFGPPFGSIPMQSAMTGGMFSPSSPFTSATGPLSTGLSNMPGGVGGAARGGGLLARLFGRGAAQSAGSSLLGGGLQSAAASGGMNFSSMLTNAQKVVGLTQQVMPMVHQYGPLIRNMPMIWKIMRSNNSSDVEETPLSGEEIQPTTTQDSSIDEIQFSNNMDSEQPNFADVSSTQKKIFKPKTVEGIPLPKLYI
ncbi:VrrA/YqfQ family protein [Bacillus suaedae]|uniref:YqfQ-like protein n=1 Tax=Halalkalibacter suaedae TaxID=2822140 RepID=A0A940WZ68_9BACI|nr:VrrA/YqfQ family protein [Bacillus suaedae]MBP3951276.1 hypothetical protein [Bacillus suaedae]